MKRIILASTAAAIPVTALGADLLPLKIGIYVQAPVACKGASRADIVNYWGGKASIGMGQVRCTIVKLEKQGKTYTVTDKCTDIAFGGIIEGSPRKVTIAGPTNFTIDGTAYKYCGTKVQF